MLDLQIFRDDPDRVQRGLRRRGIDDPSGLVRRVVELDETRREAISRGDELRARRNQVSKEIGERKRAGEDAGEMIAEMRSVAERIDELEATVSEAEEEIRDVLLNTPNLPLDEVPEGGEEENEVVREWGEPPEHDFSPLPHWELGESLGLLDLARAARISGSGFPLLTGVGARLQRALIDFMLELHVEEHGYRELRIPYLVTRETMTGTGQLPKFEEDSYVTETDRLWLIPTAEVPITNLHRDELLAAEDLPLRYTAYSPCFRREAGAAGKDTRGLLRVHQFDKVELVRYERPDRSRAALEELTGEAEKVLRLLDLHYRVVVLATADLGFSAGMTYDLEVWAPGVEKWLEVSSCSTFLDYQARRANLRYRPAPGEAPEYVHTLNGSGLALPRLMVALLETYQRDDGSVDVPEALRPHLGRDRIGP